MQVTREGGSRSPAALARRAQIVQATIAVIAQEGYPQASFARIAEQAGLSSTRLISYHFTGKEGLVAAVVHEIVTAMGDQVGRQVRAQPDARGMLRAYVEGVVAYTAAHREDLVALLQILTGGGFPQEVQAATAVPGHVERILAEGQRTGQFRPFDVRVTAMAVQRAVEGVAFALHLDADLDVTGYGVELADLFERATRADAR